MTDDTTLYLTTLRCMDGHDTTFAHEGADVPLDVEAPWPDAEFCPACSSLYPDDLGAATIEVAEAERVKPERSDENDVFEEALRLWGEDAQHDLAVEECAELIVAVHHWRRGRATRDELIEEFVDVYILMEQMAANHGSTFDEIYDRKFRRLKDRVSEAASDDTDPYTEVDR